MLSIFSFATSKEKLSTYDAAASKYLEKASEVIKKHLVAAIAAISLAAVKLFDLLSDSAPTVSRLVMNSRSSWPDGTADFFFSALWAVVALCFLVAIYLVFLWLLQVTCHLLANHEKGVVGGAQILLALIAQGLKIAV